MHELNPLRPGQIRLRVHGVRTPMGAEVRVSGEVFARKLMTLVKALKAADAAVNGTTAYDYRIADLQIGSAVVQLDAETQLKWAMAPNKLTGTEALGACVQAVAAGKRDEASRYGDCANQVIKLANGAGKSFAFGELWIEEAAPIRVDDFLADQAKIIIEGVAEPVEPAPALFRGTADASFYGEVKEADLRGELPQVKLILAGAGKEIDCICTRDQVEQIRTVLDRRAKVAGRAFYDGLHPLPRRLTVRSIDPVRPTDDFKRWRGAFEPISSDVWPEAVF